MHFRVPEHTTIQCFQVCLQPEKEDGVDPQQELLSKLIVFCLQDDGEPRQKGVRFHPHLQPLGSNVLRKVALRTLPAFWGGGVQQRWNHGPCPLWA